MDYQELFNYMANNHNVLLLESEMNEIIHIVKQMLNNSDSPSERRADGSNSKAKEVCPECNSDDFSIEPKTYNCQNCGHIW